jgi:hypothetical protein
MRPLYAMLALVLVSLGLVYGDHQRQEIDKRDAALKDTIEHLDALSRAYLQECIRSEELADENFLLRRAIHAPL